MNVHSSRQSAPSSRGGTIAARSLGEAWLDVADLILTRGAASSFGGLPMLEVELVTLDIAEPDPDDALIAQYASPDWLAWMRGNFTDHARVSALGDARSYASRLFDYAGSGRDQLAWVIETLSRDPVASYASITTFEPLSDTAVYSLRQPARFLAALGSSRTHRLCPQHRFRQEGLRQPGPARRAAKPRRCPPRQAGRQIDDDRQIRAHLRNRACPDGRSRWKPRATGARRRFSVSVLQADHSSAHFAAVMVASPASPRSARAVACWKSSIATRSPSVRRRSRSSRA